MSPSTSPAWSAPADDGRATNRRRATLFLLEHLSPDPLAEEAARSTLLPLFGPQVTDEVLARRERAQLLRRGGVSTLLTRLSGRVLRGPGQWLTWWDEVRTRAPLQAVPLAPRQDVHVEVQHGLGRRGPVGLDEVQPPEIHRRRHRPGDPLRRHDGVRQGLVGDGVEIGRVLPRDDQREPLVAGVDVHEGHGVLVLVQARARNLSRDDLGEDDVRLAASVGVGQSLASNATGSNSSISEVGV